jgi:hypothetical protein
MVANKNLKIKKVLKQSHLILITNKEILSFALSDAAALKNNDKKFQSNILDISLALFFM